MERSGIGNTLHCQVGQCEDCKGTGWYGDNGPGIPGNTEFVKCDCGTATKCTSGYHKYRWIDGVPWCDECGLEADMDVCKLTHVLPNAANQARSDSRLQSGKSRLTT